jgi:hypothetical protein
MSDSHSRFALVSAIQPDDRRTWTGRIFLTLDIDWAADDVLSDSIDVVEAAKVPATWFVTHETPLLGRLRSNPLFELGIHPNFNPLLAGERADGDDAATVIDRLQKIVPEARVVRSHSMAQSSQLLQLFRNRGFTHDCNHFIPAQAGIVLGPWLHWNGLIKVPYFWEDDVHCQSRQNTPMCELTQRPGLRVFDFHPIHVYLNTETMERYERTREIHHDSRALRAERSGDPAGARELLFSLLKAD